MQHGEELPLVGRSRDWGRPCIETGRFSVSFKIEDVHHAFPDRRALMRLFEQYGLCQPSRAAVQALDCLPQLVNLALNHVDPVNWTCRAAGCVLEVGLVNSANWRRFRRTAPGRGLLMGAEPNLNWSRRPFRSSLL